MNIPLRWHPTHIRCSPCSRRQIHCFKRIVERREDDRGGLRIPQNKLTSPVTTQKDILTSCYTHYIPHQLHPASCSSWHPLTFYYSLHLHYPKSNTA